MSEYRFRKGDTGKCRGGNIFEVVAEYTTGLNVATRTDRIAVLLTHSDGNQSLHTMLPDGRWRDGVQHHHDLLPPTEKRWIVRAEQMREPCVSVEWGFNQKAAAENHFAWAKHAHGFFNQTLTEVEIPLTRR